jgi:hypothetical protein
MKLNSSSAIALLAGIALLGLNQSSSAQQRTFVYSAADNLNSDFSRAGTVNLKSVTSIEVQSYLYISGNLGANWIVDGWGTGQNLQINSIMFYHSETLSFQFEGFADAAKISGTSTGAVKVKLRAQVQLYNNADNGLLFDSGLMKAVYINSVFQASGPSFGPKLTSGVMRMDFARAADITDDVGPGLYQNVGTITVVRN